MSHLNYLPNNCFPVHGRQAGHESNKSGSVECMKFHWNNSLLQCVSISCDHMGHNQTGHLAWPRGRPSSLAVCLAKRAHLASSFWTGPNDWKPGTRKYLLRGGNFLGAQAWITCSAIRTAVEVMLECVQPCNHTAILWTAAPGCAPLWGCSIRMAGSGTS